MGGRVDLEDATVGLEAAGRVDDLLGSVDV
jgi:hypothetical protein